MPRTSTPLWLANPSRFAGISRNRATVVLLAIVFAVLLSLTALIGPKPITQDPNPPPGRAERADVLLYESIVAAVRNGGNYYRVAADAQRLGGYPVRPFVTMRLPTLAVLQAALPPLAVIALLWALIAATAAAWAIRLRPVFSRSLPHIASIALLACGLLVYANRDIVWFHEIWSGVLIALSLALWRPGRAATAIAIAACAMLIRETAALYAIIMALAALKDSRRREALGWGVALALLAAAVAAHHFGWSNVAKPDDPIGPGWSGMLGIGFAITTIVQLTAFSALPLWLAAPLIALALAGWASWNDPLAVRVLAVLVAYLALLAIFCRADTYYSGLSIAALVPLGLAFAIDGIRDLVAAALDRRRITVDKSVAMKRVLLIVGGGIAAYKACELVRLIRKAGHGVRCVLTEGGSHFVTPMTLAALSEDKVYTTLWDLKDEAEMGHIQLSREADLVVVAPATADLLARMATGIADDLATTLLLATDKPVLAAPAMNVRMWQHAATRRNVAQLREDGIAIMDPGEGAMACGEYGPGRLPEPAAIMAAIERSLRTPPSGRLTGKRILVTAGPTQEPIDPVRYLANRSSGKQGFAIAGALAALGAEVTLIAGPVSLATPGGVTRVDVVTAQDMANAVAQALPVDAAIMVAAVADWRVENTGGQKIKKGETPPALQLAENPDILATLARSPRRPGLVIGFAAETERVVEHATAKRTRKGADWIVANDVSGDVMGGDANTIHIVTDDGVESWDRLSKNVIAHRLADRIADAL